MRTVTIATILGLFCVGVLGGCDTQPKQTGQRSTNVVTQDAFPRVEARDGLADKLIFGDPLVRGDATTPMAVQVPFTLRSESPLNIEYQFRFFDRNGNPVPARSTQEWTFRHLPAGAQFFFDGFAAQTRAVDWRLIVRVAQ